MHDIVYDRPCRAGAAGALLAGSLILAACSPTGTESPVENGTDSVFPVEESRPLALAGEWAIPVSTGDGSPRWLSVGETSGARLHGEDGQTLAHWDRPLESLAVGKDGLFASFDTQAGKPVLFSVDPAAPSIEVLHEGQQVGEAEALCLGRLRDGRQYLFIVQEDYRVRQLLVHRRPAGYRLLPVRELPVPPETDGCAVDSSRTRLYLSEKGVGVHTYEAHPEAPVRRQTAAMGAPWGSLGQGPVGLAGHGNRLFTLEEEGGQLLTVSPREGGQSSARRYQPEAGFSAENLTAAALEGKGYLVLGNGDGGFLQLSLPESPESPPASPLLPAVEPLVQTETVASGNDAADDPAIWVHPDDPTRSLILGTDKKAGLYVYDLTGKVRQFIGHGRLNNVDVRYGARLAGKTVDLAAASNRSNNRISLYAIDRANAEVRLVTELATGMAEIYGLCLYAPADGSFHVFVNDKEGRFEQHRLRLEDRAWTGERVRRFSVPSQPEGCVADDQRERLFLGEEAVGIHVIGANPDDGTEPRLIAPIDDRLLYADVEGLALYRGQGRDYLVASAQGNDSYAVYQATPPYQPLGGFRIGMNLRKAIDGVSETDGLAATARPLGPDFPQGVLVVQDGRKVMPEGNQNFKLVPWEPIQPILEKTALEASP